mgnify:CR=1 FL=1
MSKLSRTHAKNDGARLCLYDDRQLAVLLDGMAGRLASLLPTGGDIVLVGVLRRGVPLAGLLAERLCRLGIRCEQRLDLEVKRYADDLSLLYPQTMLRENDVASGASLAGKTVVVVDDVLYRGHSLLRVVQYLASRGAAVIRSVVLVDRGVGLLPVHADVIGARLEVAPGSIIEVQVPPYEMDFRIELVVAGS